jgi:hypothetical protein
VYEDGRIDKGPRVYEWSKKGVEMIPTEAKSLICVEDVMDIKTTSRIGSTGGG